MATVNGTFTGVGVSANLDLPAKGESVTYTFSGGTDVIHWLEREVGSPGSGMWNPVLGPYTDDDGSDSPVVYVTKETNERLRARCTSYGSGTLTYSFSDSDKVTFSMHDPDGNLIFEVTQAGIRFPGTVAIDGALTQTGIATLANALNVGGAIQADAALNVDGAVTMTDDLDVTGDIQGDAALNIDGAATLTDTLEVTGVTTLTDTLTQTVEGVPLAGVGVVNGTGVSLVEGGNSAFHKTTFTLTSAVIPTATTGDAEDGVGGLKLYDFPEGNILILGVTGDLSSLTAAADQSKLVDGATNGDIGLGSIIPANNDSLGSDGTDDDISGTVAFLHSSHTDTDISMLTLAPHVMVDDGSDLDLILTGGIDDAEITDTAGAVTVDLEMTGEITIIWCNLGTLE